MGRPCRWLWRAIRASENVPRYEMRLFVGHDLFDEEWSKIEPLITGVQCLVPSIPSADDVSIVDQDVLAGGGCQQVRQIRLKSRQFAFQSHDTPALCAGKMGLF